MIEKLLCPFCQQELYQVYNRQRDTVIYNCTHCYFQGNGIIWEYLINIKKKLDICIGVLEKINDTRSVIKENLYASYGKSLNSGNVFCWTTPDEIHNALTEIKALTKVATMSDMKCGAPKDYKCTPYNHKTCANCRYVIYESTRKHIIQTKGGDND